MLARHPIRFDLMVLSLGGPMSVSNEIHSALVRFLAVAPLSRCGTLKQFCVQDHISKDISCCLGGGKVSPLKLDSEEYGGRIHSLRDPEQWSICVSPRDWHSAKNRIVVGLLG